MKNLLFIIWCNCLATLAMAQPEMRAGRHILNYPIQLTPCTFAGASVENAVESTISENTIFYIRNVTNDSYIIQIAEFTRGETQAALTTKNQTLVKTAAGNNIYFKLSKTLYDSSAEVLEDRGSFTVGAATTLIKIRPGNPTPEDGYPIYSEFGNDFNIGLSAGWKIHPNRHKPTTHSLVGGLSFSSIKVTPYTTRKFITSESTQSCITLSLGYILEYNKFQFSAFSGYDIMSGEISRHWIYQNRPWLGLGFGYQIFRAEGDKTNTTKPAGR